MSGVPTLGAIIARNIRRERAGLRLDQGQLAERMGVSRSTVSDLESGQRRITAEHLPQLCRALEVPFAKLIEGAETEDLDALGLS